METAKKKVRYYKNVHIIWICGQVALILQRIMRTESIVAI